jgi:hypothetical protein
MSAEKGVSQMKAKQFVRIIAGLFAILFPIVIVILVAFRVVSPFFNGSTMIVFNKISEVSLYSLTGLLFLNFIGSMVKGKLKKIFESITLSLVYLLLGLTIISVNVHVVVWSFAVSLTTFLTIYSVLDIPPPTK